MEFPEGLGVQTKKLPVGGGGSGYFLEQHILKFNSLNCMEQVAGKNTACVCKTLNPPLNVREGGI